MEESPPIDPSMDGLFRQIFAINAPVARAAKHRDISIRLRKVRQSLHPFGLSHQQNVFRRPSGRKLFRQSRRSLLPLCRSASHATVNLAPICASTYERNTRKQRTALECPFGPPVARLVNSADRV